MRLTSLYTPPSARRAVALSSIRITRDEDASTSADASQGSGDAAADQGNDGSATPSSSGGTRR